jgi:hypothetical protein
MRANSVFFLNRLIACLIGAGLIVALGVSPSSAASNELSVSMGYGPHVFSFHSSHSKESRTHGHTQHRGHLRDNKHHFDKDKSGGHGQFRDSGKGGHGQPNHFGKGGHENRFGKR